MRKSKTKTSKKLCCGSTGPCKCRKMDPYNRIVSVIWFLAALVMAVVFVSSMSSAMASVVINSYDRQVSIGDVQFNSSSRVIATNIATASFVRATSTSIYDVSASLDIPVPNVLSYQLFTATSFDPRVLIDMNVYGCVQQLNATDLNSNTIMVGCKSTSVSPRIPNDGDKILARYYYIPGAAIYHGPLCGNGVIEYPEVCDEATLNGQPGHCNSSCSGLAPVTSTTTPTSTRIPVRIPTPRQPNVTIEPTN
ncbi:MAG: hypothetical protein V1846_03540 [Candidatus Komeilibacteria bacterium]